MKKRISQATSGRAGLVVALIALSAALSSTAIGLPGKNSVNSGDIRPNAVTVKDLKIAYVRTTGTGVVTQTKNVIATFRPVPNVLCMNLRFPAKAGSATRGLDAGAPPVIAPQMGLPPTAATLGCPAPFVDAVVQLPGVGNVNAIYATFFG